MTRRRVVVLSSAVALLSLVGLVALAFVTVTQTEYGRGKVRDFIETRITSAVRGKTKIGRISGSLLTGVTIDTFEIRDSTDRLFVASGPIRVSYDVRDLIDRRILLSSVDVERPVIYLAKDPDGRWNYQKIFPKGPDKPKRAERGFGDYIVIDTATVHDATFVLELPWTPSDSLRGARRDSAIAYNLTRKDKAVRRNGDGFLRTFRWTGGQVAASHVRLAEPDSAGRFFAISHLDVDESDPPFSFRNVRGSARMLGDSVWFALPHFDLPGSTGSATGKVVWGSSKPVRYDLRVVADSVTLSDVAWVYPTLPRTGGGKMVLHIRNEPQNLDIIDYALSEMDVRTTRSRLRGKMTFGVGGPVLVVKDLDVAADPIDFDLIRTFNGKPLPYDWQGQLIGTVRGRGGPVNRFRIDDAELTFRDANVPGAVSRLRGRGELDILFPAFTEFRGFAVDVAQLDLRTLQFLNADFPRLGGLVSGRATLDSSWLDVRFRDADLTHRDGPGDPTRVTGSGRLTTGDEFLTYDLAVNLAPISFTTLARSYDAIPLRGSYTGPLRLQGTLADLLATTELTGPAGSFGVDGRFDLFEPGFGAAASATITALDVRALLADTALPPTSLTGRMRADVTGDSLRTLAGTVTMTLDRSLVDGTRIYGAEARTAFGGGRVRFDTLHVETAAATIAARGALGLRPSITDSIAVQVYVDSLGGLRRYLIANRDSGTVVAEGEVADSLTGSVTVAGTLVGSIDTLGAAGTIEGHELFYRGERAARLAGNFSFADVLRNPAGTASLTIDTATVGGIALAHAGAAVRLFDRSSGEFAVSGESVNGPRALVFGRGRLLGDTAFVSLDTAQLSVGDNDWRLERAASIVARPDGITVDSLVLRGSRAGWLSVAGTFPDSAPVRLNVAADSIPLTDLGLIAQTSMPFGGRVRFAVDVTGMRADPTIVMTGSVTEARFGDVRLDRALARGRYEDRRLRAGLDLYRGEQPALLVDASLPVDLSLAPVSRRLLDDSLGGTIRSDSVAFGIIEALSPSIHDATGKFVANLDIGGTWKRPALTGEVRIENGEMGIIDLGSTRMRGINAELAFFGDSVAIRRASVISGEERGDSLWLTGGVSVADYDNPRFDLRLRARNFHAIERARVAHLDVSGDLRLVGEYEGATLTGGVIVERGSIFIPELVNKQVISLDDDEFYKVVDTTVFTNRSLLPKAPPAFVRNLAVDDVQIRMGQDVWLRSDEANINLGGTVGVTVAHDAREGRQRDQLALTGQLLTNRGTYRLALGIVQRTFEVESGTIRFFGEPDFNPTVDINAVHTVRQFSSGLARNDIRIRVNIGGTLSQLRLALSSGDDLQISESDLLSYLVTGGPSDQIGDDYARTTTSALLSSVNSYFLDRLRGNYIDVLQFQTAADRVNFGSAGVRQNLSNLFLGTRLGVGKQIDDRTFVSANAGLCQVGQFIGGTSGSSGSSNPLSFADAIGFKIEHRLNAGFGVSAGVEPPTDALLCGGGNVRGFAPTPKQWGFDVFKTWRF